MAEPVLHVQGLKELRAELRRAGAELPKALRLANLEASKTAVPSVERGAPRRSGRLAGSVRALATQSRSQVAVGTNVKVPYAFVINFGWPAHNIAPQEFVYSGIDRATGEILDVYEVAIDKLTARAFPIPG